MGNNILPNASRKQTSWSNGKIYTMMTVYDHYFGNLPYEKRCEMMGGNYTAEAPFENHLSCVYGIECGSPYPQSVEDAVTFDLNLYQIREDCIVANFPQDGTERIYPIIQVVK